MKKILDDEMFKLEDRVLFDAAAADDIVNAADAANDAESEGAQNEKNESDRLAAAERDALVYGAGLDQAVADATQGGDSAAPAVDTDLADPDAAQHDLVEGVLPNVVDGAAGGFADSLADFFDQPSYERVTVDADSQVVLSSLADDSLVVIDGTLPGSESLLASADIQGRDVLVIDSDQGLEDVLSHLQESGKEYGSIHFFTHANRAGVVKLGADTISDADIQADVWRAIGEHLTDDGDVMFYGCDLADSGVGRSLCRQVAELTDADVAASDDVTGVHGDWQLEYTIGDVDHDVIDASDVFEGDLAAKKTITVNLDSDVGDATSGHDFYDFTDKDVSLREAVEVVNSDYYGTEYRLFDSKTTDLDGSKAYYNATIDAGTGAISIENEQGEVMHFVLDADGKTWRGDDAGDIDTSAYSGIKMSVSGDVLKTASFTDDAGAAHALGANKDYASTYEIKFSGDAAKNPVLLNDVVTISDSQWGLTIDGGSKAVLSGGGQTRIFAVSASDVRLTAITLEDGFAAEGGAVSNTGTLTLDAGTVFRHNAAVRGGAIFNAGTIVFAGTAKAPVSFEGNAADDGGAIYNASCDGLAFSDASHVAFRDNAAARGGAVYGGECLTTAGDVVFSGNAAEKGGAVYLEKDYTLATNDGTVFAFNAADAGGAVYVDGGNAVVLGGEFSYNHADVGGAFYVSDAQGAGQSSLSVSGGLFDANYATGTEAAARADALGGAVYVAENQTAHVLGGTFEANMAGYFSDGTLLDAVDWSAFDAKNPVALESRAEVNGFRAVYSMAGALLGFESAGTVFAATVKTDKAGVSQITGFTDGTVKYTVAWGKDGAGNPVVSSIKRGSAALADAEAEAFRAAFAAFAYSAEITVEAPGKGGALYYAGDTTATGGVFGVHPAELDGGTFKANVADAGGAVYVDGRNLFVDGAVFEANQAKTDGGAIGFDHVDLRVENAVFRDNAAEGDGGAIHTSEALHNLAIAESSFDGNAAGHDGGAIYVTEAGIDAIQNVTVADTDFARNSAGNDGGAVYLPGTATADFRRDGFDGNAALRGGAVYLDSATAKFTDNNVFRGNTAEMGGALLFEGHANADVDGALFENNAAEIGGALAVFAGTDDATVLTVVDSTFRGNRAVEAGGAAYLVATTEAAAEKSLVTFDSVTFEGNSAREGGALFTDSTVAGESAPKFVVRMNEAIFRNNEAESFGGAASNGYGVELVVNSSLFSGNAVSEAPDAAEIAHTVLDDDNLRGTIAAGYDNVVASVYGGGAVVNRGDYTSENTAYVSNSVAEGGPRYFTDSNEWFGEYVVDAKTGALVLAEVVSGDVVWNSELVDAAGAAVTSGDAYDAMAALGFVAAGADGVFTATRVNDAKIEYADHAGNKVLTLTLDRKTGTWKAAAGKAAGVVYVDSAGKRQTAAVKVEVVYEDGDPAKAVQGVKYSFDVKTDVNGDGALETNHIVMTSVDAALVARATAQISLRDTNGRVAIAATAADRTAEQFVSLDAAGGGVYDVRHGDDLVLGQLRLVDGKWAFTLTDADHFGKSNVKLLDAASVADAAGDADNLDTRWRAASGAEVGGTVTLVGADGKTKDVVFKTDDLVAAAEFAEEDAILTVGLRGVGGAVFTTADVADRTAETKVVSNTLFDNAADLGGAVYQGAAWHAQRFENGRLVTEFGERSLLGSTFANDLTVRTYLTDTTVAGNASRDADGYAVTQLQGEYWFINDIVAGNRRGDASGVYDLSVRTSFLDEAGTVRLYQFFRHDAKGNEVLVWSIDSDSIAEYTADGNETWMADFEALWTGAGFDAVDSGTGDIYSADYQNLHMLYTVFGDIAFAQTDTDATDAEKLAAYISVYADTTAEHMVNEYLNRADGEGEWLNPNANVQITAKDVQLAIWQAVFTNRLTVADGDKARVDTATAVEQGGWTEGGSFLDDTLVRETYNADYANLVSWITAIDAARANSEILALFPADDPVGQVGTSAEIADSVASVLALREFTALTTDQVALLKGITANATLGITKEMATAAKNFASTVKNDGKTVKPADAAKLVALKGLGVLQGETAAALDLALAQIRAEAWSAVLAKCPLADSDVSVTIDVGQIYDADAALGLVFGKGRDEIVQAMDVQAKMDNAAGEHRYDTDYISVDAQDHWSADRVTNFIGTEFGAASVKVSAESALAKQSAADQYAELWNAMGPALREACWKGVFDSQNEHVYDSLADWTDDADYATKLTVVTKFLANLSAADADADGVWDIAVKSDKAIKISDTRQLYMSKTSGAVYGGVPSVEGATVESSLATEADFVKKGTTLDKAFSAFYDSVHKDQKDALGFTVKHFDYAESYDPTTDGTVSFSPATYYHAAFVQLAKDEFGDVIGVSWAKPVSDADADNVGTAHQDGGSVHRQEMSSARYVDYWGASGDISVDSDQRDGASDFYNDQSRGAYWAEVDIAVATALVVTQAEDSKVTGWNDLDITDGINLREMVWLIDNGYAQYNFDMDGDGIDEGYEITFDAELFDGNGLLSISIDNGTIAWGAAADASATAIGGTGVYNLVIDGGSERNVTIVGNSSTAKDGFLWTASAENVYNLALNHLTISSFDQSAVKVEGSTEGKETYRVETVKQVLYSTVTVEDSAFVGNKAGANLTGGAIDVGKGSVYVIGDSAFTGNAAEKTGGAINVDEGKVVLGAADGIGREHVETDGYGAVRFECNTADGGGAISVVQADDTAAAPQQNAYALDLYDAGLVLSGYGEVFFSGNEANLGGAVSVVGNIRSASVFADMGLSGNAATTDGGAFHATNDVVLDLARVQISGNSAGRDGGAIFAGNDVDLAADKARIFGNSVENLLDGGAVRGGAIYAERDATLSNVVNLEDNRAVGSVSAQGGAVYAGRDVDFAVGGAAKTGYVVGNQVLAAETAQGGAFYAANDARIGAGVAGTMLIAQNNAAQVVAGKDVDGTAQGGVVFAGENAEMVNFSTVAGNTATAVVARDAGDVVVEGGVAHVDSAAGTLSVRMADAETEAYLTGNVAVAQVMDAKTGDVRVQGGAFDSEGRLEVTDVYAVGNLVGFMASGNVTAGDVDLQGGVLNGRDVSVFSSEFTENAILAEIEGKTSSPATVAGGDWYRSLPAAASFNGAAATWTFHPVGEHGGGGHVFEDSEGAVDAYYVTWADSPTQYGEGQFTVGNFTAEGGAINAGNSLELKHTTNAANNNADGDSVQNNQINVQAGQGAYLDHFTVTGKYELAGGAIHAGSVVGGENADGTTDFGLWDMRFDQNRIFNDVDVWVGADVSQLVLRGGALSVDGEAETTLYLTDVFFTDNGVESHFDAHRNYGCHWGDPSWTEAYVAIGGGSAHSIVEGGAFFFGGDTTVIGEENGDKSLFIDNASFVDSFIDATFTATGTVTATDVTVSGAGFFAANSDAAGATTTLTAVPFLGNVVAAGFTADSDHDGSGHGGDSHSEGAFVANGVTVSDAAFRAANATFAEGSQLTLVGNRLAFDYATALAAGTGDVFVGGIVETDGTFAFDGAGLADNERVIQDNEIALTITTDSDADGTVNGDVTVYGTVIADHFDVRNARVLDNGVKAVVRTNGTGYLPAERPDDDADYVTDDAVGQDGQQGGPQSLDADGTFRIVGDYTVAGGAFTARQDFSVENVVFTNNTVTSDIEVSNLSVGGNMLVAGGAVAAGLEAQGDSSAVGSTFENNSVSSSVVASSVVGSNLTVAGGQIYADGALRAESSAIENGHVVSYLWGSDTEDHWDYYLDAQDREVWYSWRNSSLAFSGTVTVAGSALYSTGATTLGGDAEDQKVTIADNYLYGGVSGNVYGGTYLLEGGQLRTGALTANHLDATSSSTGRASAQMEVSGKLYGGVNLVARGGGVYANGDASLANAALDGNAIDVDVYKSGTVNVGAFSAEGGQLAVNGKLALASTSVVANANFNAVDFSAQAVQGGAIDALSVRGAAVKASGDVTIADSAVSGHEGQFDVFSKHGSYDMDVVDLTVGAVTVQGGGIFAGGTVKNVGSGQSSVEANQLDFRLENRTAQNTSTMKIDTISVQGGGIYAGGSGETDVGRTTVEDNALNAQILSSTGTYSIDQDGVLRVMNGSNTQGGVKTYKFTRTDTTTVETVDEEPVSVTTTTWSYDSSDLQAFDGFECQIVSSGEMVTRFQVVEDAENPDHYKVQFADYWTEKVEKEDHSTEIKYHDRDWADYQVRVDDGEDKVVKGTIVFVDDQGNSTEVKDRENHLVYGVAWVDTDGDGVGDVRYYGEDLDLADSDVRSFKLTVDAWKEDDLGNEVGPDHAGFEASGNYNDGYRVFYFDPVTGVKTELAPVDGKMVTLEDPAHPETYDPATGAPQGTAKFINYRLSQLSDGNWYLCKGLEFSDTTITKWFEKTSDATALTNVLGTDHSGATGHEDAVTGYDSYYQVETDRALTIRHGDGRADDVFDVVVKDGLGKERWARITGYGTKLANIGSEDAPDWQYVDDDTKPTYDFASDHIGAGDTMIRGGRDERYFVNKSSGGFQPEYEYVDIQVEYDFQDADPRQTIVGSAMVTVADDYRVTLEYGIVEDAATGKRYIDANRDGAYTPADEFTPGDAEYTGQSVAQGSNAYYGGKLVDVVADADGHWMLDLDGDGEGDQAYAGEGQFADDEVGFGGELHQIYSDGDGNWHVDSASGALVNREGLYDGQWVLVGGESSYLERDADDAQALNCTRTVAHDIDTSREYQLEDGSVVAYRQVATGNPDDPYRMAWVATKDGLDTELADLCADGAEIRMSDVIEETADATASFSAAIDGTTATLTVTGDIRAEGAGVWAHGDVTSDADTEIDGNALDFGIMADSSGSNAQREDSGRNVTVTTHADAFLKIGGSVYVRGGGIYSDGAVDFFGTAEGNSLTSLVEATSAGAQAIANASGENKSTDVMDPNWGVDATATAKAVVKIVGDYAAEGGGVYAGGALDADGATFEGNAIDANLVSTTEGAHVEANATATYSTSNSTHDRILYVVAPVFWGQPNTNYLSGSFYHGIETGAFGASSFANADAINDVGGAYIVRGGGFYSSTSVADVSMTTDGNSVNVTVEANTEDVTVLANAYNRMKIRNSVRLAAEGSWLVWYTLWGMGSDSKNLSTFDAGRATIFGSHVGYDFASVNAVARADALNIKAVEGEHLELDAAGTGDGSSVTVDALATSGGTVVARTESGIDYTVSQNFWCKCYGGGYKCVSFNFIEHYFQMWGVRNTYADNAGFNATVTADFGATVDEETSANTATLVEKNTSKSHLSGIGVKFFPDAHVITEIPFVMPHLHTAYVNMHDAADEMDKYHLYLAPGDYLTPGTGVITFNASSKDKPDFFVAPERIVTEESTSTESTDFYASDVDSARSVSKDVVKADFDRTGDSVPAFVDPVYNEHVVRDVALTDAEKADADSIYVTNLEGATTGALVENSFAWVVANANGRTVRFAEELYVNGTLTIELDGAVALPDGVVIDGGEDLGRSVTLKTAESGMFFETGRNAGLPKFDWYQSELGPVAGSAHSLFTTNGGEVTFRGVRLLGGTSVNGAVIDGTTATAGLVVNASSTLMSRGNANGYGGAVAVGGAVSLNLVDSQVASNNAAAGGGAVVSGGNITVSADNAAFAHNETESGDGGALRGANVTLVATDGGLLFVGNEAGSGTSGIGSVAGSGGAVFAAGRVDVGQNIAFLGNAADGEGGAIHADRVVLADGDEILFADNWSKRDGGAIWTEGLVLGAGANTFKGNEAGSEDRSEIYVAGTVSNGYGYQFESASGFSTSANGGAIRTSEDEFTVSGTRFVDNAALDGENTYAAKEHSGDSFGGDETAVRHNAADDAIKGRGGAIHVVTGGARTRLTVTEGALFKGNEAGTTGGAVYYETSATDNGIIVNGDARFLDNAAGTEGGAIRYATSQTLEDSNKRDENWIATNILVEGARFDGNVAGQSGGAVYNDYGFVTLKSVDTFFTDNIAVDADAGAIHNAGTTSIGSGVAFDGNQAGLTGGALHLTGFLSVNAADFHDNKAGVNGGAAYLYDGLNGADGAPLTATIVNASFIGNVAGDHGGALSVNDGFTLTEHGSLYNANYAVWDGGAIDVDESTYIADGIEYLANKAGHAGGAANNFKASVTVDDSRFVNNVARVNGGAIANYGDAKATTAVGRGEFSANLAGRAGQANATGDGGAVFADAGSVEVVDSSFASNVASHDGGAVYANGGAIKIVQKTADAVDFSRNAAGHVGGALAANGGSIAVSSDVADGISYTGNVAGALASVYGWVVSTDVGESAAAQAAYAAKVERDYSNMHDKAYSTTLEKKYTGYSSITNYRDGSGAALLSLSQDGSAHDRYHATGDGTTDEDLTTEAGTGGAVVAVTGNGSISVDGVDEMTGNTAVGSLGNDDGNGGVALVSGDGADLSLGLNGADVSGNEAVNGGFLAVTDGGSMNLTDVNIGVNGATENGGQIYVSGTDENGKSSSVTIDKSSVQSGYADADGDGTGEGNILAVADGAEVGVSATTFADPNGAGNSDAAAVSVSGEDSELALVNVTITDNPGAGVSVTDGAQADIVNTIVLGNEGAAIETDGDSTANVNYSITDGDPADVFKNVDEQGRPVAEVSEDPVTGVEKFSYPIKPGSAADTDGTNNPGDYVPAGLFALSGDMLHGQYSNDIGAVATTAPATPQPEIVLIGLNEWQQPYFYNLNFTAVSAYDADQPMALGSRAETLARIDFVTTGSLDDTGYRMAAETALLRTANGVDLDGLDGFIDLDALGATGILSPAKAAQFKDGVDLALDEFLGL